MRNLSSAYVMSPNLGSAIQSLEPYPLDLTQLRVSKSY